ncbi:MAG: hypothetical protein AAGF95_26095, partial [Chloroflexota bacterium]
MAGHAGIDTIVIGLIIIIWVGFLTVSATGVASWESYVDEVVTSGEVVEAVIAIGIGGGGRNDGGTITGVERDGHATEPGFCAINGTVIVVVFPDAIAQREGAEDAEVEGEVAVGIVVRVTPSVIFAGGLTARREGDRGTADIAATAEGAGSGPIIIAIGGHAIGVGGGCPFVGAGGAPRRAGGTHKTVEGPTTREIGGVQGNDIVARGKILEQVVAVGSGGGGANDGGAIVGVEGDGY